MVDVRSVSRSGIWLLRLSDTVTLREIRRAVPELQAGVDPDRDSHRSRGGTVAATVSAIPVRSSVVPGGRVYRRRLRLGRRHSVATESPAIRNRYTPTIRTRAAGSSTESSRRDKDSRLRWRSAAVSVPRRYEKNAGFVRVL